MTPSGGPPLARFSVLDLTTVRSGPTCTKMLAGFGPDVIRVERPGGEGRERVFFDAADLPVGTDHPLTAPMGVYRARDQFFSLAVGNDDMWKRFCKMLDRPALVDDPRFSAVRSRVKHRQTLDAVLAVALAARPAAEWIEMLNAAGVAGGPINTVDQVFADPQIQKADLVREVSNATWGPHKVLALPVHLSRTPARVERAAPMTGEHTRGELTSLGSDAATAESLLADGVIETHKGETT